MFSLCLFFNNFIKKQWFCDIYHRIIIKIMIFYSYVKKITKVGREYCKVYDFKEGLTYIL